MSNRFKTYEYKRESYLKRVYNLTQKDFHELSSLQNHCCKICGIHKDSLVKGLCVDHCHSSGEIRGLLCGTCNRWIVGAVKTPELLRKAADYLESSRTGRLVNPKYKHSVRKRVVDADED